LILGDSDYIKKKFGVGYRLCVSIKKTEEDDEELLIKTKAIIQNLVLSKVLGSSVDLEFSKNDLNFVLPFFSQNQFADLFFSLENFNGNFPLFVKIIQYDSFYLLKIKKFSLL